MCNEVEAEVRSLFVDRLSEQKGGLRFIFDRMRLPFHGKSEESFGNTLRAGRIIRLKTVKRIKNQQQKSIKQTKKTKKIKLK